jgi:5,10-methylenetetrahydrofolate reductase
VDPSPLQGAEDASPDLLAGLNDAQRVAVLATDGDPPAASRYTEARMTGAAMLSIITLMQAGLPLVTARSIAPGRSAASAGSPRVSVTAMRRSKPPRSSPRSAPAAPS